MISIPILVTTLVYTAIGLVIFIGGFWLWDRISPVDMDEKLARPDDLSCAPEYPTEQVQKFGLLGKSLQALPAEFLRARQIAPPEGDARPHLPCSCRSQLR